MKHLPLILGFIITSLLCMKCGTVDDVNSGSIFGMLLSDEDAVTDDTVTVSLYSGDDSDEGVAKVTAGDREPIKTFTSIDGSYEFNSLPEGTYDVIVTKNDVVIGSEKGIRLKHKERKEVDITIVFIINQTFNIWTDNSQNITVNNIYIDNGSIKKIDSGYVLTTAETDTLIFKMEVEKDEHTSTITVRSIRNEDGTATFEIIDSDNEEIKVTITPGTGPATAFLGDITIHMDEPGTTEIESIFDTSDVPEKSR